MIEVAVAGEAVARRELPDELPLDGTLHEIGLPFELGRTETDVEFRVQSYGTLPVSALLHVAVERGEPAPEAAAENRLESAHA